MVQLVHQAPEPLAKRIRRNGLVPSRVRIGQQVRKAVFAFPVIESFTLTHQWARELKRRGQRTFVSVTFRIADEESVFFGHYGEELLALAAAEAVDRIRAAADPRGLQILVPRRVLPAEIVRILLAPQGVGWRYYPDAHCR